MATVLITGIGRGIGKALAEKFSADGYEVIGTVRNGEASSAAAHTVTLDLTDAESVAEAARAIRERTPAVDILINNAGVLLDGNETSLKPDFLQRTLAVNLIGTAAFTEAMKDAVAPGGHIVNISSAAGSITLADGTEGHSPHHYPAYKISKAALNMYTRTLADELKGKVTVSSIHPGWVKTDIGGRNADLTPAEAAESIFALATSHPETGQFWFRGERLPW